MRLAEAVGAGGVELDVPVRGLVVGDHALAAAGVAGQGVAAELGGAGQQPGLYERLHQDDEAAGVAAGGGHSRAGDYRLAPRGGELGEAVGPAGGHTVGRGGVHNADGGVFDHRHGLAARGVGQAEHGEVAGVERRLPRRGVLSGLAGEGDELEIGPVFEPGVYAQPGRTGAAVYEYLSHAVTCFKYSICAARFAGEAPPREVRFATHAAREMSS